MRKKKILLILLIFFAFVFFNNTSLLVAPETAKPLLLAHRGLAQCFSMDGITNSTDTSKRIFPPDHPFLENTIASMAEAIKLGADIVEVDIQITKDEKVAVFHDHGLDYRTDASGQVRKYTMADLKKLDVGYGYSADGGKTFPFRGKGVGLMPELDEVLKRFPQTHFLIDVKSNDTIEGEVLARYLESLPKERLESLKVYGGQRPLTVLKEKLPGLRVMSRETLMKAITDYIAIGWTGYIPQSCRGAWLHIPVKYAPLLWGWPDKFMSRMKSVDTQIVLVAGDGKFSEGFDSPDALKQIPQNFSGYIWTNRIDKIAPAVRKR